MMNNTKRVFSLSLCVVALLLILWVQRGVADALFAGTLVVGYVVAHVGAYALLEHKEISKLYGVMLGATCAGVAITYGLHHVSLSTIFYRFGLWTAVPFGLGFGLLTGVWFAPAWLLLSRSRYVRG